MSKKSSTERGPDQVQQALERLARNQPVDPQVLRAVLSDAGTLRQLLALLQARDLFEPPAEIGPESLPPLDVPFEDLALYVERKLADPVRVAAVEQFLRGHFPGALETLSA